MKERGHHKFKISVLFLYLFLGKNDNTG